ncbi:Rne/Rng family ribonuclease [Salibacterium qingdaonense]|uniref:Ribonuclease G n=1 Tax=Salibacterium qingdaonense TaxID=266892 RepID=A0A1I4MTG2_9BACI|nr:Rne/Rng family ribonuclease [Salibacterium qingdaonense]SFM06591.1 ribonuclease G [Salibacterium qingdaonense]
MIDIFLNTSTTERRAALQENGRVTEIFVERPDENRIAGNIYKGRVKDVLPGMQAAFVDIGREKNGFLYRDELAGYKQKKEPLEEKENRSISEFITQGQTVLVQVLKEEFGKKGAKLTENVSLSGKYTVYLPEGGYTGISKKMQEENREGWRSWAAEQLNEEEGVIIRTICEQLDVDIVAADIDYLREDWKEILSLADQTRTPGLVLKDGGIVEQLLRDYSMDDIHQITADYFPVVQQLKRMLRFEERDTKKVAYYQGRENLFAAKGIEKEVEKALKPNVWLKNGGFLVIEKTEALTVIDVNTGRYTGGTDLMETVRRTNLEAAAEIAVQLRLRDISGIVIIDFIDMKKESHKEEVIGELKQALKKDRTTTNVTGMSTLGLVEMTRKKVRRGVEDLLLEPCSGCRGTGRRISAETLAYQAERYIHECRGMESEALVIEMPKRVHDWLHAEGSFLLETWTSRYSFVIYTIPGDEKSSITIRYTGIETEARRRKEALEKQAPARH